MDKLINSGVRIDKIIWLKASHAIRRSAEALKLAAGAELAKVSPLDVPDSVSKLWDDLSDFLAAFDAEMEQPDPRIGAGERMAAAAREG